MNEDSYERQSEEELERKHTAKYTWLAIFYNMIITVPDLYCKQSKTRAGEGLGTRLAKATCIVCGPRQAMKPAAKHSGLPHNDVASA